MEKAVEQLRANEKIRIQKIDPDCTIFSLLQRHRIRQGSVLTCKWRVPLGSHVLIRSGGQCFTVEKNALTKIRGVRIL